MNYLSKEGKKEYKEAKRFFGFEATKVIIWCVILSFVLGGVGIGYKLTIGKANMDANREVFEHNKSYVHGMVEDLARYKLQYSTATDETEKKAIIAFITENYSNFDGKLIENDSLREFYYDVMEGRL